VAASRTAFSAHAVLRLRSCARLRNIATASLMALSCAADFDVSLLSLSFGCEPGRPGTLPSSIGVAAPILVPGAMAARWDA
jgi:hypothetical protein